MIVSLPLMSISIPCIVLVVEGVVKQSSKLFTNIKTKVVRASHGHQFSSIIIINYQPPPSLPPIKITIFSTNTQLEQSSTPSQPQQNSV